MPEPESALKISSGTIEKARRGRNARRMTAAQLIERACFFLTLSLIILAAIPYGSVEVWWSSAFSMGVFAVASLWAIEALLRDDPQLRRQHLLFLPALALLIFSLLQTIPLSGGADGGHTLAQAISADPFGTRVFALRFSALILLGALLLRFTTSRRRLQALVLTVICVGAASAVFGLMRQAMQQDDLGFVLPSLPRGVGYGQIISRNQFAFMMEMSLGLALGMAFRRGGGYEKSLFHIALALPVGAALILANSRGGILTMMCQILFLSLLIAPARKARGAHEVDGARRLFGALIARAVIVLVLLFVVSSAVVWVGGERVVSNLSTVQDELGADDSAALRWNTRRVDIWRATWEMIKEHPVAGTGFGGYWIAITQYHDASGAYTPQQAHNDYLELIASGGVIGAAIALWFAFVFLKRARVVMRRGDSLRRAACVGALTGLFGVAVHSLFDFGLHITINAALFVALIVIATTDVQDNAGKAGERSGR